MKHNPRARQRKETLAFPPIHPDCMQAYEEILAIGRAHPVATAVNWAAIVEAEAEA